MRDGSDRSCKEYQTHLLCAVNFFKNHAIDGIMWKNSGIGQVTDHRVEHAHCILDT